MTRRRRLWLWLRGFRIRTDRRTGQITATGPVVWCRYNPERAAEILDELMLTRDPNWKRPRPPAPQAPHDWNARQVIEAVSMLRTYVDTPSALDREVVAKWLEENHPGQAAYVEAMLSLTHDYRPLADPQDCER